MLNYLELKVLMRAKEQIMTLQRQYIQQAQGADKS